MLTAEIKWNEDVIVAVVIAIYAIGNEVRKKDFGTSADIEPMRSALAKHCSTS